MAVVAIDATGAIRGSNATAEAFFGRSLTLETPLSIAELIPEVDLAGLFSAEGIEWFNASRSLGDAPHMRANRADGSHAFIDVQAVAFSALGERFLTLFVRDSTSVLKAEATIQDLRARIAYNWRLSSLREVASLTAHELSQPLSAIFNFLHAAKTLIARPEIDRKNVDKYIRSAESQAERASDVIQGLRSVVDRDAGFHKDENVAEVVGEIMPILELDARAMNAALLIEIGHDAIIRCDRDQVQQLILNLVHNALEAPETGDRRQVRITGVRLEDHYRLVIEDNGPGVPTALENRLFDPFFSTKIGGMGLGLSICRTIVEAHGGSIDSVPSALGGAAFAITLGDRGADA